MSWLFGGSEEFNQSHLCFDFSSSFQALGSMLRSSSLLQDR